MSPCAHLRLYLYHRMTLDTMYNVRKGPESQRTANVMALWQRWSNAFLSVPAKALPVGQGK